jgi:catalase
MALDPREAIDRITAVFRGPHPGARTLHAKGAFFAGTFTATPEAAGLTTAAHLRGDPVPVLVRWSNGSGYPGNRDTGQDVRGMAVSFRPASGGATDLLGQTAPRFPVRTPEAFVALTEASRKPLLLPLFLARHPSAAPALLANVRARAVEPPWSYAEATYYPVHAYGWVDDAGARTWVRYLLAPLATKEDRPEGLFEGRERLQEEIVARLAQGPVGYDVRVTVAADGDDPHDPMSVWTGGREFSAGVIEVTEPVPDPEADGDVVVFDPTRVADGITLSEDPILHYRPLAYTVSAERRSGFDHRP